MEVRIPPEVRQAVRAKAARTGFSLERFVTRALLHELVLCDLVNTCQDPEFTLIQERLSARVILI